MEKNKKNFTLKARPWSSGDLVKIKPSTWEGRAHARVGLLIKEVKDSNNGLFPYAIVYDMRRNCIGQYYLYDLELISAAA